MTIRSAAARGRRWRRLREAFWDRLTHDPGPIAPLTTDQVRQLCDLLTAALEPRAGQ